MLKNIAIVSGGDSGEYPVSVKGAEAVFNAIDTEKYIPYITIILKY